MIIKDIIRVIKRRFDIFYTSLLLNFSEKTIKKSQ
jgi:hypothetical protein